MIVRESQFAHNAEIKESLPISSLVWRDSQYRRFATVAGYLFSTTSSGSSIISVSVSDITVAVADPAMYDRTTTWWRDLAD